MEHMDEVPDHDYHLAVADTGVWLEFDAWGWEFYFGAPFYYSEPKDTQRVACTKYLVDRGYIDQLLIGQDICMKMVLKAYGGLGYDCFLKYGVPMLKRAGIGDAQIHTLLVANPMRVLPMSL